MTIAPQVGPFAEAYAAFDEQRFEDVAAMITPYLAGDQRTSLFALHLLAKVRAARYEFAEAERLYSLCLEAAPDFDVARLELVRLLYAQQKAQPMLPHLAHLLESAPQKLPYRTLQASAFSLLGHVDRTVQIMESLLADYPNDERLYIHYGNALKASGYSSKAIQAFRKGAQLRPSFGEAWFCLSDLKTYCFSTDEIAVMQAQAAVGSADINERVMLEFAIGKAMEDAKEYKAAFEHYVRGNALRRSTFLYDISANGRFIEALKQLYTPQFFEARVEAGLKSPGPIFIIGLPRSGSTLLEQILASHSQVEGTRELTDLQDIASGLGIRNGSGAQSRFINGVRALTSDELRGLGQRYLDQTRPNRIRAAPYFIDKMPVNFYHVGLIQLILPAARIIDARRSPMACCFANFKQYFHAGALFSYELSETAQFYRDYVRLMSHYEQVLPGRVHRVDYENLIYNFEGEVRRLLDYCGLPFEEQCLRFYETKRMVHTSSSEQVRHPISTDGVHQWRNFEPWLGDLKAALADV